MRRRTPWILAALLLMAAAAYLMAESDSPPPPSHRPVSFPRALRPPEVQRMRERQRRLAPAPERQAPAEEWRPRDPLLVALPQTGKSALVIEANAIRNSPLGELLIRCFSQGEDAFTRMRDESGIDALTDLDRVALSEEGLILSGNFKNARWDKLGAENSSTAYGGGIVYSRSERSSELAEAFGRWGDQLIVLANSGSGARAILDRLSAPSSGPRAIGEEATYGEIYGVIGPGQLAELLGDGAPLADRIREAAPQVEVHVDAREDVAIVAQVRGRNRRGLSELEKAVTGLLSASRVKAKVSEDKALAQLLELARVLPRDDGFDLELALPLQFFREQLGSCADPNGKTPRTVR